MTLSTRISASNLSACISPAKKGGAPADGEGQSEGWPGDSQRVSNRVQVLRLGRDLAELDLFHLFDELCVGRGGTADFLALGGDQPIDEVDLGAPALEHVLPHRRPRQFAAGVRLQAGKD